MEIRLESTRGLSREAEVWVDGTLLVAMDEYSAPDKRTPPGLLHDAKFMYMAEEGVDWPAAIRANPSRRKRIEPVRGWRYVGYGRVVDIMPVVIDFGLLCMEDANWTNEEQLVGQFVRVEIDRLSLVRAAPDELEDVEPEARPPDPESR